MTRVIEDNTRMLAWLTKRLDNILARPEMWGGQEAVELQVLQLLELEVFINDPASNQRLVLDKYNEHSRKKWKTGVLPASARNLDWTELIRHLNEFRNSLKPEKP